MANFILSAFADEADKNVTGQIAALKANNITHIEPRGIDGVNISEITEAKAKELRKIFDDNGIGVSALGSPFGKIGIKDDFAPHFELFKKGVEIANILGTKNIRMFSFFMEGCESYEPYRDEVFERLSKMCDYSLSGDIWCCHENEKGIYGDTDDRCLEILSTLKGKIKGVFDPANFVQCGVNTLEAYEKLGEYIEYMHIKDALFEDGSVVPPGKGDGNVAEVLKLFSKKDGERFLTLEPHLKVFDGLAALEQKGGIADKLKNVYTYESNEIAFKTASDALHTILENI